MGKNTMMRRSIRLYCERTGNDQWLQLLDHMIGNVGLIFTKGDLNEVRGAAQGPAGGMQRTLLARPRHDAAGRRASAAGRAIRQRASARPARGCNLACSSSGRCSRFACRA